MITRSLTAEVVKRSKYLMTGLVNSANVAVVYYIGLDNQNFPLENVRDSYYQFRAHQSGRYLEVEMGSTAPNANV